MDKVVTVAVAKGIAGKVTKEASAELAEGTHNVDAYVHVKGFIKKAKDEDVDATVSLSLLETLALTLHYAGATRESAMKAIQQAVETSLVDGTKTQGILAEKYDWIEGTIDSIKKNIISKLPKVHKSGKVTTKLVFEEVPHGKLVQEKVKAEETEKEIV